MKTKYLDEAIQWMKRTSNPYEIKKLQEYEAIKERLLTDKEFTEVLELIKFSSILKEGCPIKNKIEKILK